MGSRYLRARRSSQTVLAGSPAGPLRGLVLALVIAFSAGVSADVIYLQGSTNPTFNQRFTELLQAKLGEDMRILPFERIEAPGSLPGPIVTLGPEALRAVLEEEPGRPVLALLVSRRTLLGFTESEDIELSGVFYDPPLLRQALIGRSLLPQANRMALLARPESAGRYDELVEELRRFGLSARVFVVTGEDALIPTLIRALSYGDFLLATPDDSLFNARSIKHILLTTYRRNRLVVGPSHAFVRAGVLASSYIPLPDYAAVAAEYLQRWQQEGVLPPPSYPTDFAIELNRQVARSLNIPLPESETIVDEVMRVMHSTNGGGGR